MTFHQFCSKHRVRIESRLADSNPNNPDWEGAHHFRVTLKMHDRQLTTPFSQGYGIPSEPTAEGVLNCLVSDTWGIENARNFEEWCSEYGYDTDSRKAESLYRACTRQATKLRQLADSTFDELMNCRED